jgi:tRNA-dihydrouridine synthase
MSVKIGNIDLGEFPLLLAPMEDVSDPPFRFVCKQNGVDMMYTEFISSEGLIRDAAKSVAKLDIFEYERPIGSKYLGARSNRCVKPLKLHLPQNPTLSI